MRPCLAITALLLYSGSSLASDDELSVTQIGNFRISWDTGDPYLQIHHVSDRDKVLFQTLRSWPFITVGFATDTKPPIVDGNFKVSEWTLFETPYQSIKKVRMESNKEFIISGEVWGLVTLASYEMRFYVPSNEKGEPLPAQLAFEVHVTSQQGAFNRVFLNYWCDAEENFYGFGTQYTYWNLKGRRVPILVAEQGIGRGAEPLTSLLNLVGDRAGGDWSTTYAPKPLYVTNFNRSLMLQNSEMMFFDTRDDDSIVIEVWGDSICGRILYGASMLELITQITEYTGRMQPLPPWTQRGAVVGLEGGTAEVLQLTERLLANKVPVPLAGVWVQDWVGLRHAFDGDRLNWNWQLDSSYYPEWANMVTSLAQRGVRIMSYINPFFSDKDPYASPPSSSSSSTSSSPSTPVGNSTHPTAHSTAPVPSDATTQTRNLYREGIEKGYFVQSPVTGVGAYRFRSGSIDFAMLDTTHPAARVWMKDIIKQSMVRDTGVSGWMADFGEYLPFDAVLHDGSDAKQYHNIYPQEWARINHEAKQELLEQQRGKQSAPPKGWLYALNRKTSLPAAQAQAKEGEGAVMGMGAGTGKGTGIGAGAGAGKSTDTGIGAGIGAGFGINASDLVYFMRSAWLQSPPLTSVFWLGDQLVSWDRHDGIKSVLVGAISSGVGGHSLTHSDIGGYTMQEVGPLPFLRTRELLLRWVELSAFGSALFRTHIGLITSPSHAQVFDDPPTMTHFARLGGVFAALAEYRSALMQQAAQRGWPLIRHMAAHYAHDARCWELVSQYMFGEMFLIAPVLDPAAQLEGSQGAQGQGVQGAQARNSEEYAGLRLGVPVVKVYIPQHSSWIHLWSGQRVEGGEGRFVAVDAPIQAPPVFYRPESAEGQALRRYVLQQGMGVDVMGGDSTNIYEVAGQEQRQERGQKQEQKQDQGQKQRLEQEQGQGQGSRACMRLICDWAEPDWYDWLGIKQYVSVTPWGTTA
ncbi:glycosyl hydrolases family 31-domain-containing protein [Ochromonadaceae sp. CCMP2298]|nr:glycosyl hydrolases family 31-domain-containing protein [Ochromonadaceae sp. CCMP2298]|mmetsp:Transcript_18298/g.40649  ORF Transcript_18298/g.40649 Transcript_18298/m.40649 type:complete len:972 (+) Transcript_18298:84-2999(+)